MSAVESFRPLFSRCATFLWFAIVLIGFVVRQDHFGVSSIIRWMDLPGYLYESLLHFFHSTAWNIEGIMSCWWKWVAEESSPVLVNSRMVLLGDHTKQPKDGRRIPGVVTLHEESETSSKPSFFRGHQWGFIGLLNGNGENMFCTPLLGELHQGFEDIGESKDSEGERCCMTERLIRMALRICSRIGRASYLVLDAFFSSKTTFHIAASMFCIGQREPLIHVITRAKKSYIAYEDPDAPRKPHRGRPAKYGKEHKLYKLFDMHPERFQRGSCIIYGKKEEISFLSLDLLWKPMQAKLRFVMAETSLGRIVLMCSDFHLTPLKIVELYCYRVRIETMFSILKNVLGGLLYRFWSKYIEPQSRRPLKNSKDRKRVREDKLPRVLQTWKAISGFVNFAAIVQGLLQIISIRFGHSLFKKSNLWMRTYNRLIPSEFVIKHILSQDLIINFPDFSPHAIMKKIQSLKKGDAETPHRGQLLPFQEAGG